MQKVEHHSESESLVKDADVFSPSVWAKWLGYLGLIPFVVLAFAVWVSNPAYQAFIAVALVGYGATIASFLGAMHWGFVMRDNLAWSHRLLAWGVTPSLVAWLALLVEPLPGLLVIAGLLCACFVVDSKVYPRLGVQAWLPMRLTLTVIASAACIAGALGMLR
jgi:Protein of unknown function (DUF3429)